jgi:hypothetical protein
VQQAEDMLNKAVLGNALANFSANLSNALGDDFAGAVSSLKGVTVSRPEEGELLSRFKHPLLAPLATLVWTAGYCGHAIATVYQPIAVLVSRL